MDTDPQHRLSISAVERDTGLTKDTLRVWERRYGFPVPERAGSAERAYPQEQVDKLKLIKRLMDAGHRPGQIVAQPIDVLQRLSEAQVSGDGLSVLAGDGRFEPRRYLDLIRSHDLDRLRRELQQSLLRLGAERFLFEVIVPLNTLIGDSWMRGHLEVFEEHFYTETLHVVLRGALSQMSAPDAAARPRVLLTSFPTESRALGMLMGELLMRLEGCHCVSLGVQTPVWDTVLAATSQRVDIVAVSFTSVVTPHAVGEGLTELRSKLPPSVEIWAGGRAPVLHRRRVPGVRALGTLSDIGAEVERWRAERA